MTGRLTTPGVIGAGLGASVSLSLPDDKLRSFALSEMLSLRELCFRIGTGTSRPKYPSLCFTVGEVGTGLAIALLLLALLDDFLLRASRSLARWKFMKLLPTGLNIFAQFEEMPVLAFAPENGVAAFGSSRLRTCGVLSIISSASSASAPSISSSEFEESSEAIMLTLPKELGIPPFSSRPEDHGMQSLPPVSKVIEVIDILREGMKTPF